MPLILTDEYVKKNCMSQYPVPLKALKGLKPNRDKTPNYITKLGRTGIKQIDLPIYSPASVRSLANSISNISKLERDFVNGYLENMINSEMDGLEDLRQILAEEGESAFLEEEKAEELDDDLDDLEARLSEEARSQEALMERMISAESRMEAMDIDTEQTSTTFNPRMPTKAEIDYIGGGDPREYGRRGGSRGGSGGEL